MSDIKLFTIGFTRKTAEYFFGKLGGAGVERIIDIRLNNSSQLAGFAKRDDLQFFLGEIGGIGYHHVPDLAPTKDLLDGHKKREIDWETFESGFIALMQDRRVELKVEKSLLDRGCLLCSEDKPEHCHRRLVAEYLQEKWGDVSIEHLV